MYKNSQKPDCPQNPYTAAKIVRKILCLMKQGKSWIDFPRCDDSLRTIQSSDVRLETTDNNVSLSSGYDWSMLKRASSRFFACLPKYLIRMVETVSFD